MNIIEPHQHFFSNSNQAEKVLSEFHSILC